MFEVSADTIDITPTRLCELAGYDEQILASAIGDNLEANAIVVRDEEKNVLLLSLDLLYVGEEIIATVCEIVGGWIPRQHIFCFASHTHFAPATDSTKPKLGKVDPIYLAHLKNQLTKLLKRIKEKGYRQTSIKHSVGSAKHSVNRRRFRYTFSGFRFRRFGPYMQPNKLGIKNEQIHRWTFFDANTLRRTAEIWKYSCHPVNAPDRSVLSAHFPGVVRGMLRETESIPVLFLQGFSGDVRPAHISKRRTSILERMMSGLQFETFSDQTYLTWCESLGKRVLTTRAQTCHSQRGLQTTQIGIPLTRILPDTQCDRVLNLRRLVIGSQLDLLTANAEPTAGYDDLLPANVVGIGCEGDVYGYLPLSSEVREGGYESNWHLSLFGIPGKFVDDVEFQFSQNIKSLFDS